MSRPILPGFHPDPTICRVGDDFYLATSSFEYFPGVPLFHSTDLLTWTQLGNVLDRPSQLPLTAQSGGIFAPTLRHHDGRFWMITTQIDRIADGHLIVTATDPAGPWSEPVFTTGTLGIDPDLAWDDDGVCHLSWTRFSPTGSEIVQARLDPESGALLSPPKPLWNGTGLAHAEAPHLHRRGDWWYLLIAEGGTERGHAVSIARSRSIDGPFESNPANPILSHRSTDHPVQNTGHADLVQLPSGDWAMVYLGVRPRGMTPGFHVNGRETFLAGIDWVDDWPVVDESRHLAPPAQTGFVDRFDTAELDPRWISPGGPPEALLTRGVGGGVTVPPLGEAPDAFLGVRTRDERWQAELTVAAGDAALVLRLDAAHLVRVETDAGSIRASARIGDLDIPLGQAERPAEGVVLAIRADDAPTGIGVRSGPDILRLGTVRAGVFAELASLDGRYVSTEVAGGFTGRVIGFSPAARGGTISSFSTHRIDEDDA
ncbi:glycoside hydrolase family 43 protein [Microterricola pindariensis]|uniref:Glycoside hydrolase 43 family protein n=1 Tax=Microterricola pindariensis TaxID=478010 RepID=A0ABX5AW40_9MICO|nr:glycoside hydrolase family 43 protein [Microterricola pindariensis]PPL19153.1 glycoside hydrolase 43 family protein [Microterricola pindariensis]